MTDPLSDLSRVNAQLAVLLAGREAALEAMYGRHEAGFIPEPLIDPPDLATIIRNLKAEIATLRDERDGARETLRFCEREWSKERGTMIDSIQAERARALAAEQALAAEREACANLANDEPTLYFGDELGHALSIVRKAHARCIAAAIRARSEG